MKWAFLDLDKWLTYSEKHLSNMCWLSTYNIAEQYSIHQCILITEIPAFCNFTRQVE